MLHSFQARIQPVSFLKPILFLLLYRSLSSKLPSRPHHTFRTMLSLESLLPFPRHVKDLASGHARHAGRLVEIKGLEPSTYGLQSRRSSQLSYIPVGIHELLD